WVKETKHGLKNGFHYHVIKGVLVLKHYL
ncbi:hypothetical protein, partial [uncultured Gammaproteobacteria bacterium]